MKHAWEAAAPYMNASIASETNGIWTIELYRRPSGANEVRFETPDGASYWGSQYENGAWRYDWPERIPGYVKGRARRLWARYPDSFTRRVTSL